MAKESYAEKLEGMVMDAAIKFQLKLNEAMPLDVRLESVMMSTFEALTPEEQIQLVDTIGPEDYLKLAAKIEKLLAPIDEAFEG